MVEKRDFGRKRGLAAIAKPTLGKPLPRPQIYGRGTGDNSKLTAKPENTGSGKWYVASRTI
jgi:hypothetical protein